MAIAALLGGSVAAWHAQSFAVAASLLPLVTLFEQGGEQPWYLWVPALAQATLMNRVLRGEPLGAVDIAQPLLLSALPAAACLAYLARRLRAAAVR